MTNAGSASETNYATAVTVEAPIDRAFKVFTEGFDTWWPRTHHIATPDMAEAILEPRLDGRWGARPSMVSTVQAGRPAPQRRSAQTPLGGHTGSRLFP